MDKIAKVLDRLSPKERLAVKIILERIQNNKLNGLDVKKLKGYDDIFRVRKGKIRIIYRLDKNNQAFILTIEKRTEKTYKF